MNNKITSSDIYSALVNYARENEVLIYTVTGIYFAVALPLAGVALGAGEYGPTIETFTAISGLILSIMWFIVVERCRRWFTYILSESAEIERDSGYINGRASLYDRINEQDNFIRFTPRSSVVITSVYILSICLFFVLTYTKLFQ